MLLMIATQSARLPGLDELLLLSYPSGADWMQIPTLQQSMLSRVTSWPKWLYRTDGPMMGRWLRCTVCCTGRITQDLPRLAMVRPVQAGCDLVLGKCQGNAQDTLRLVFVCDWGGGGEEVRRGEGGAGICNNMRLRSFVPLA